MVYLTAFSHGRAHINHQVVQINHISTLPNKPSKKKDIKESKSFTSYLRLGI